MRKACYIRFVTSIVFLLVLISRDVSASGLWYPITSAVPEISKPIVLQSDIERSVIQLNLRGFQAEQVSTPRGNSVVISSPGATPILKSGAPDLPKFAVSLVIPDKGQMEVRILTSSYVDYPGMEIAPSKGDLLRTIQPSDVPYRYGSDYDRNAFFPASLNELRDPFIFRDFRGQTLLVQPFQYNPQTKVLRVFTEMTVEVYRRAVSDGINELNRAVFPEKINSTFAGIYSRQFGNFSALSYIPLDEGDRMLVICPANWIPLMEPYVQWKTKRGIHVEVMDVAAAGSSAGSIQQTIAGRYFSDSISYVLLVGDVNQCPVLYAQGGPSDPSFGYILGSDSYTEVMVGRFSAESDADVMTQVARSVNYECLPDTIANAYNKAVVVASDQGPGDDNEYDWEHAVNMRNDLMGFTYSTVSELYDGTHAGTTDAAGDPSNVDLFQLFQSGIGLMTYTGHGSSTSCGTTGLSNNDVQNMTNFHALPFILSVACVNGQFDMSGGPCFAEKFLRAQNNSQPTGAVATLMSSINQSWNPPMDAQDEMVDILTQSFPANQKFTFGGIAVNGCMHMNDQYGQAGAEMTDTWHCFGDPSLLVRTGVPQSLTVNHPPVISLGSTSVIVACATNGSLVSFTVGDSVLSVATVSNGTTTLSFPALTTTDTIFVTVTGFNAIPYQGFILVIPLNGPYLLQQTLGMIELQGNNNGDAEYGESIQYDLQLENIGPMDANAVSVVVSCTDLYISNLFFSLSGTVDIPANGNLIFPASLSFNIASDVPDMHVASFSITMTDTSGNIWTGSFNQTLKAPALSAELLMVLDTVNGNGNGILESGETGWMVFRCYNSGHSDAITGSASLSSSFSSAFILNSPLIFPQIAKGAFVDVPFEVSLGPNISIGTPYDLQFTATAGSYNTTINHLASAGLILEDFETANFNRFPWTASGNTPWAISAFQPFEGSYSAISGPISANQTTELNLNIFSFNDDSLSFYYKVSTEDGWDFLNLYIDGNRVGQWSGIYGWRYASFAVSSGSHQIKFTYEKDAIVNAGQDRVWLDNIRFPFGTLTTGLSAAVDNGVISLWPNPASAELQIKINESEDVREYRIFNTSGVQVKFGNFSLHQRGSIMQLDVSDLVNGSYYVQLRGATNVNCIRFQVIR